MDHKLSIKEFLSFIDSSPTAWHAAKNCEDLLLAAGFQELDESDPWELRLGGKYFVTRNRSSVAAFVLPKERPERVHLAASHNDSPSFKIKPRGEFLKENMVMLGLEIYGSPLISSWLNRDLGIAGVVVSTTPSGEVQSTLVDIDHPGVVIPQLAIHLDRNSNETGPSLNKQEHLAAIASTAKTSSFIEPLLKKHLPSHAEILCFDLFLYPLEKGRVFGDGDSLISAYRLDNLASTYAILSSMMDVETSPGNTITMAAFWNHEEIGSDTAQGAASPFISNLIERITLSLGMSKEEFFRMMNRSLCISADAGHSLHPTYADKHEPRHFTLLNQGIAIKSHANQKYASDVISITPIIVLCKKNKIPYQHFIPRGDIPSGSTIGPVHATATGMSTVDIGCPLLSMHSCREIIGSEDLKDLKRLITAFYQD